MVVEWSGTSLGKATHQVTLPKYGFLASPPFDVHLKQFQLHGPRNRFGPALHVQFGEDILVVPLDRAQ